MKTVLVNKPIHPDALKRLSEEVDVLTPFTASRSELIGMLSGVQGVVLCLGLDFTSEIIDHCKVIEVIGRHGAGVETVDVEAATRKNIPVVFTPYGPTESTAEHAFMLMMATARKLSLLDREIRAGNFHIRDQIIGRELFEASVGIIGFGRIGQRFAQMCKAALDMKVHVFDPLVHQADIEAWGAVYETDIVEMARKIDVLSLHCPLTDQTHHVVNSDVIGAMKPDAIFINASRGPLTDESALVEALQQNRIAGAGLDVYDPEPPEKDNPLFALDNVVLTPHLASFTDEGRRRMGLTVAEDVLSVLRGDQPKYPLNQEVL
jgi:D-3-phosphoglycerate dehydrogenase